jgi:two-component system chemotaxis response regulator CheY
MRGMVAYTLRGAGHEVTEAENGQLALDAAAANGFDLVLADVNMPVMDGISMVRELRTRPNYKGVPILMLTTESHTDKKMEGKAAGATGWLVKPFDPEQLLATVKRVLG